MPSIEIKRMVIYPTRVQAEALAAQIGADDDGWTYTVAARASGGFVIEIHDESGEFVGHVG